MKKKLICIVLAILLLPGCDSSGGTKLRVITTLSREEFSMGFRQGDKLRDIVAAGLSVLAADGVFSELSVKWFGKDVTSFDGDADALDKLGASISRRVFIMGLDESAPPMSFRGDDGKLQGFDVDLAWRLCDLLGWDLMMIPISPDNIEVELGSGNIDCAWGAMSFKSGMKADTIGSYMRNEKVLVVLDGSNIRSKNGLRNKNIGMTYDPISLEALESDETLADSILSYTRYGSTDELLSALMNGSCDAALMNKVTVDYLSR